VSLTDDDPLRGRHDAAAPTQRRSRPVPLAPLLPLFHRLNREHFAGALCDGDGQALVSVRWSDGRMRRSAGLYRYGRDRRGHSLSEIVLSRPLLDPLPWDATASTLCHEMIHAWVHRVLQADEVHGPQFRARMAVINAAQQEFVVSVRHRFPVPVQPAAWIAHCPSCGLRSPYRRRRSGLACRPCCERLHGGRWHADCLLRFEPNDPAQLALEVGS